MNPIDIILAIFLLLAIIQGIRKGFVVQVASLLAIVVGVWAAFKFSSLLADLLAPHIDAARQMVMVVAFIILLVVVIVVIRLLGKLLKGVLKIILLGWLDKLLGVIFALLKMGLILGVIICIFDCLNSNLQMVSSETLGSSVLYQTIREAVSSVFPYLKELIN